MEVLQEIKKMVTPEEFIEVQGLESIYQEYFYAFLVTYNEEQHNLLLTILRQVEYLNLTGTCDDISNKIISLFCKSTERNYNDVCNLINECLNRLHSDSLMEVKE